MSKKLKEIEIEGSVMLVTPIPDYFKESKNSSNWETKSQNKFGAGIIEKVGDELPQDREGRIIYYIKNVCDEIDLPDIGKFLLVPEDFKALIRLDQDRNNY